MRVGFDLDGTLADLHTALAREAARLFPSVNPAALPQSVAPSETTPSDDGESEPEPVFSTHALTARQQRELWRAVCARVNFWETLDEIEAGALARLFQVVRDRRWELIFLTSRP